LTSDSERSTGPDSLKIPQNLNISKVILMEKQEETKDTKTMEIDLENKSI